jgi:hypothetical protein
MKPTILRDRVSPISVEYVILHNDLSGGEEIYWAGTGRYVPVLRRVCFLGGCSPVSLDMKNRGHSPTYQQSDYKGGYNSWDRRSFQNGIAGRLIRTVRASLYSVFEPTISYDLPRHIDREAVIVRRDDDGFGYSLLLAEHTETARLPRIPYSVCSHIELRTVTVR